MRISIFFYSVALFMILSIVVIDENHAAELEKITFLSLTNGFWQVYTIKENGSSLHQITHSPIDKVHLSKSLKRDEVLVNTNQGKLFVCDLENCTETTLNIDVSGMTDTTWSIDGQKVFFSLSIANSIDANDIWLVNINDHTRRRLTNMKHMQHDPALSHDEKQLVFVSGAGGQNHDLFVLDIATGATRQLTVGQRYHFEPACSINDEIAFSSNRSDDYEIWVSDFEGKRFEQITHSSGMDGQPTWSPDGKKIAFVSSRGGHPAIWVINRDGSNVHQVSPNGMRCRGPVWGRQIQP